ncbi:MAG: nuclease [Candidatus Thermofonsia Clade 1 bacterium]|uniref:Nuclease n=1 Tax=Candidatus Thermofonsia Clade 1 bacterium TaxID=2364210 RepID=A0A2M8PBH8_9CHLR|nr:MAG: nuclease [Candidatus Thermofonsia Clade 1 bacterium]RMF48718.1 MAG: nuclease [Chloroflexota bacterium]
MPRLICLLVALCLAACGALDSAPDPAPTLSITYPAMPRNLTEGRVSRVVDGDTADILVNGERWRVRMLGMDTPESVAQDRPVECFGRAAAARARQLLEGQTVYLERDTSQDDRDRFGRHLRFVWFSDGRLFNLQMIAEGYAFEYTYRGNAHKYQRQFRSAQEEARRALRGLWSPDTCNGERRPE